MMLLPPRTSYSIAIALASVAKPSVAASSRSTIIIRTPARIPTIIRLATPQDCIHTRGNDLTELCSKGIRNLPPWYMNVAAIVDGALAHGMIVAHVDPIDGGEVSLCDASSI